MNPMNVIGIVDALISLRPGAHWTLRGTEYSGIEWLEKPVWEGGQRKPTKEEVDAEIIRLQQEWNNTEYQRLRAAEYPSFADQFDLLYHGGYDAWKTEIDKVKEKYPKP
jgi:hypothetical protein